MGNISFIHTADIHLNLTEKRTEADTQKFIVFNKIIDSCRLFKTDFLLICGDLFDHPPVLSELNEVNSLFGKIKPTKVILTAGNHDYMEKGGIYEKFDFEENVYFLGRNGYEPDYLFFYEENIAFCGISYHAANIRENITKAISLPAALKTVLILHGGEEKYMPFDKKEILKKGFAYTALGHIHKPEFITDRMAYCGSPQPLDYTETGVHGFIRGNIYDEKAADGISLIKTYFERCAVKRYEKADICVSAGMTLSDIRQAVSEYIAENQADAYSVRLYGTGKEGMIIEPEYIKTAGNIVHIEDDTVSEYDIAAIKAEHKEDIAGIFISNIENICSERFKNDTELRKRIEKLAVSEGLSLLLGR